MGFNFVPTRDLDSRRPGPRLLEVAWTSTRGAMRPWRRELRSRPLQVEVQAAEVPCGAASQNPSGDKIETRKFLQQHNFLALTLTARFFCQKTRVTGGQMR